MAIVHFVNYKRGTQSRAAMRGVMLYVMQEKKTTWEGEPLVSGINCQPQSVYDDFLNTKLLYHKDGGVMFYHMVQSFPKGAAVDPRQAHEAARRLAEYFDGCEVLVCTHVDREHIHSHCVINSVSFETGKKLHMAKEQLQELMRRNDAICQEMGLPVFEPIAQQARGMSGAEYHTALKGQSWKLRLMNTIDECMKYAADKDAFVSLMESEGYAVRWESTRKYITYTTPDGMRCRDSKLHEEKYCKEAMEHEFRIRAELIKRKLRTAETNSGIETDESANSASANTLPQMMQPIVIQCDLPQTMSKLTEQANGINWELEEIRNTLPELKTHIDLTPVQKSLTEMQRSLTEMNKLLERVGNLSERYSSKWTDWLPDFSLLVALKWIALLLVIGAAAMAGWYGVVAIRGLFL